MAVIIDAFTGTDGSQPNSKLWTGRGDAYGGSWDNPEGIYSNQLKMEVYSGGSQYQGVNHNGLVTGSFDIQIDYNVTSGPSSNSWKLEFGLGETGPSNDWCYIAYMYSAGNVRIYCYVQDNGSMGYEVTEAIGSAPSSGKLRIAWNAAGTTIHFYWWNGSTWDEMGSGDNWSSIGSDAEFLIETSANWWDSMSGTMTVYVDNFILNSGTLYYPAGTFSTSIGNVSFGNVNISGAPDEISA